MISSKILVAVPIPPRKTIVSAAPDLHETNTAFEQSASSQATLTKVLGDLFVQTIQFPGGLRLAGDIQNLRGADLEFCRQFIGSDSRVQAGIPRPLRKM